MQCPKCKQMLDEGVRFCPNDGTPLTETGMTRAETPTGDRPSTTREIALPATVGNRYRLEEFRGGGGMAKVYRGIDLTLEREVAVKIINPELRTESEFDSRFQREAKIASQLADPHIVVVHDFGIDPELGPFLVMEYLHGQSLRERLITSGNLPLKAGLQLAGQLMLALIHAHGKGIVHRDIKPDNIFLLNQSGVRLHVRVLDFGIARIYRRDEASRGETITHAGAVLGTPRYMSPEQLAGQPVDARSDLYSAALVIHEALTGHLPYVQGKRLTELCKEATPALQDLLDQCLKPNPSERPPTAVEVYLRLQELGKASGILLLPPGAMDRLVAARKAGEPTVQYQPKADGNKRRKQFVLFGLAFAVLLLCVAAGAFYFLHGGTNGDGPENLHGITIDDKLEDAEKHLAFTNIDVGNPWELPVTKEYMGHVLTKDDLKLTDAEIKTLKIRRTSDNKVCVLFNHDKVVAIISSDKNAATSRGLRVGSDVSQLLKLYDKEKRETHSVGNIDVRRHPTLGIGFEYVGSQVTGITLFPAKKEVETRP